MGGIGGGRDQARSSSATNCPTVLGWELWLKKDHCQLNFVLGQSKMSVYVSRKKVEDSVDWDVVLLLSRVIKARILIDFNFYREIKDLEHFSRTWTYGDGLCSSFSLSNSHIFFNTPDNSEPAAGSFIPAFFETDRSLISSNKTPPNQRGCQKSKYN